MADGNLKYPKGEHVWVNYTNRNGDLLFIMTSKNGNRDWYYLYELVGTEFKKLGKAREPPELESRYKVKEKMFA